MKVLWTGRGLGSDKWMFVKREDGEHDLALQFYDENEASIWDSDAELIQWALSINGHSTAWNDCASFILGYFSQEEIALVALENL